MRFSIREIELFERDVRLRLPLRCGVATLAQLPQAFVRASVELENGRRATGAAAELLAPKWFDRSAALSNEENFAQLRASLALARRSYLAGGANTAFGHFIDNYAPQIATGALQGMNGLVACYGPALIDRALLDALCRALEVSFFQAIRKNIAAIVAPGWQADLGAFDMDGFLESLTPAREIAARHTLGLADPLTAADQKVRVGDGLPETLEEVIARYGQRWFKLKLAGEPASDLERLAAIASVLDPHFDRLGEPYHATLDANEQYDGAGGALALWRGIKADRRLARLARSIVFIEQPLKRHSALATDISDLAEVKPAIIDESDDSLEAFPRARRLGYTGVSSRTCKGIYKSILNAARCRLWNREEGTERYFMSGEDLMLPAGVSLQQDLALVSLLGLGHVERNGHHYVDGMAALPEDEQQEFLKTHGDLYEHSHGATRVKIRDGMLQTGSLDCPGYASRAMPKWQAMRPMETETK